MRRPRTLTGWKLRLTVGLFSVVFFFVAFSLAKVSSSPESRWDISWSAVGWLTLVTAAAVTVWTFLDSRKT